TVGFIACFGQARHDLAHTAAHVQCRRTRFPWTQGVSVLGVEVRVPVLEKFGIGLIVSIGLLMAHCDLRLAICDCRFSLRDPPASPELSLFWPEFLVTTR